MHTTWIMHYEGVQPQFDRVVVVPFDEAVKRGIVHPLDIEVTDYKQKEKQHD